MWPKPHDYVTIFHPNPCNPADEWQLTGINGICQLIALTCGYLQALFIHQHAIVEEALAGHFCIVNIK